MACRVVVIFAVLFLTACGGGTKEKKSEAGKTVPVSDFPILLDGRSLKGWEVTNFGPQPSTQPFRIQTRSDRLLSL
jgi:hypothetical protein